MQTMQNVLLKIEPLVVFDLRDWYQSTFDSILMPNGQGGMTPTAIRPRGTVRMVAESVDGQEADWPFSGKSELALQQSPSGNLAFFGRLRLNGSMLAHATRRIPSNNVCKLTILAEGFQPTIVNRLAIPDAGQTSLRQFHELYPAPIYSFSRQEKSATLLQGVVLDRQGRPVSGASIQLNSAFPALTSVMCTGPVTTSEDGKLLIVLDYMDVDDTDQPIKTVSSPVQLSVSLGGNVVITRTIPFLPNIRNTVPSDVLVIP